MSKNKNTLLECLEPVKKNLVIRKKFWVSYGPLKDVYKWSKIIFSLNNSKNIDIWILRKEQNLFKSEFYMCLPNLVKINWELMELFENNYFRSASWKNGKNMTIGVSIIHFVIKVPNLAQMIVTIYRVQDYQVPITNPWWPPKIQDGRKEFQFFDIFASWFLKSDRFQR